MPVIPSAIVVVIVGGYFLARRADVRLVLLLSAAALFLVRATQHDVAGQRFNAFAQFFVEFAKGMTYAPAVVPICSAMGFAYVCKLTECDAHLVHLLVRPLRHVRWLLIPGGIAVAYLVNSAIVSQTSTVSVVGPVLIPLLLSAGISRQTAGALLLLGGSMGGELLNPAAVELTAINGVTGIDKVDLIRKIMPYNLLACGTALLVFWMLSFVHERRAKSRAAFAPADDDEITLAHAPGSIAAAMSVTGPASVRRVNLFKAAIPLAPIFLLLVVRWLLDHFHKMPEALVTSDANKIGEQAAIGAAMMIGAALAAISAPRQLSKTAATFFEGAGFAFVHVISIIALAMTFAEGMRANKLIDLLTKHLSDSPTAVTVASLIIPWVMACVTGTAVGTAPLVINVILPIALGTAGATSSTGPRIGGLNAIAAQYGRTSSPVAPVTIMCATLCRCRPLDLARRVFIPLLAGGIVLIAAVIAGLF
jgi:DcuC family C4-dicarboxylate transporter